MRCAAFLASFGSGVVFLGVPSVSLSVPSVLVASSSWLAMFVVLVCWLACFAAERSAGSCCLMRTHSHVRSLFVPSSFRSGFLVVLSVFLSCFSSGFSSPSTIFFFKMVNNSVQRSTFNSRAAGFIPSSSSQSTSTSPTVPEAILSSVANVSQPAPSATSSTVVLSSVAPPLVSPDVLAAAVAQAIGNTLPAIVSALQSNCRPVNTAPASLPVSTSSGFAAGSLPPPSSLAQPGVPGLASSAGRLQVPSFIPTFSTLPATSSPSSSSLVASSMAPLFATGQSLPQAEANLALPLPKAEKAFVVGPGHAPVPHKLVGKITNGQFVDLADLLSANLRLPEQEPQTYLDGKLIVSSSKRRLVEVKDILTWTEAFTIYQMVLCAVYPQRWLDLTKYKLLIIQTARQYPGQAWLEYDLAFRRMRPPPV